MTAAPDPDVMYSDVSEGQSQFREAQREAIGEALELPIDDARERLEQLAADEQRWIADQRRMLREMARQGRSL
jgi:hypothetical protein